MKISAKDFFKCDSGATSIEYAFIASLIAVVIVISVTILGNNVLKLYNSVLAGYPE
ncbi:MAG: Flp family type IVb pilin [Alphaproteobacteria bacterium]|nr:Flp family type IVb pilin [Alphaproteobacteria bacterium]